MVEQLVKVPSIVSRPSVLRTEEQIADIPVPAPGPSSSSAVSLDASNELGDKVFRTFPRHTKVHKTLETSEMRTRTPAHELRELLRWRMFLNSRVRFQRWKRAVTTTSRWVRMCGAVRITRYMACATGNWERRYPVDTAMTMDSANSGAC